MSVVRLKLGRRAYLFCNENTFAGKLVITSHGAVATGLLGSESYFVTPRKLIFYAELDNAMIDKSIIAITRSSEPSRETIDLGTSTRNYELTKYQTKKGKGAETYEDLSDAVKKAEGEWNVVSVRHRNIGSSTTLNAILKNLESQFKKRFENYEEIHCSFCRVSKYASSPDVLDARHRMLTA